MTSFSAILIHKSAFNLRTRANIRTNHILNIFFSSSNPENSGGTYRAGSCVSSPFSNARQF